MVNIKDVAKHAGVSVSAVSKAFNNYTDIKPVTKQKIMDAAEELGYTPNTFASNLSRKVKNSVGIIIKPNPNHDYIDEITMLYTVSIVEGAVKYKLEPHIILNDFLESKTQQEAKSYLKSKGISGVVLFGLESNNKFLSNILKDDDFKKVIVDGQFFNTTSSSVSLNEFKAQYDLISCIHSKYNFHNYLYISGSDNAFVSLERKNGILKFKKEHPELQLDIQYGDFNTQKVISIVNQPDINKYDCIICASDMMAFTVKQHINSEVLVCGFDDIRLMRYTYPNLPTISQDFYKKGLRAIYELSLLLQDQEGRIIDEPYIIKNI